MLFIKKKKSKKNVCFIQFLRFSDEWYVKVQGKWSLSEIKYNFNLLNFSVASFYILVLPRKTGKEQTILVINKHTLIFMGFLLQFFEL